MARSNSFVDTLSTVPLFSACSKKELQMVAKSADRVTVPAGKVVVNEGAAGTEFFVILGGQARVERHGRQVATLGPGGFFGDLALLDRAPRNASVMPNDTQSSPLYRASNCAHAPTSRVFNVRSQERARRESAPVVSRDRQISCAA